MIVKVAIVLDRGDVFEKCTLQMIGKPKRWVRSRLCAASFAEAQEPFLYQCGALDQTLQCTVVKAWALYRDFCRRQVLPLLCQARPIILQRMLADFPQANLLLLECSAE